MSSFGGSGGEGGGEERFSNALTIFTTEAIEGGDPKEKNPKNILKFRDPMYGFVATGFYGKYNDQAKHWERIEIPLNQTSVGENRETTCTIEEVKSNNATILPNLVGSKILTERTRGIKKDGAEIPLETTSGGMGTAVAFPKSNMKKIVYSIEKSEIDLPIPDISNKEYENFKGRLSRDITPEVFKEILEPNFSLEPELELFLQTLTGKSPKEKVIAIENFVREITYYDFDNGEMMQEKFGKSIDEKLYISKLRMDELRDRNEKLAELTKTKKYAGVCADCMNITVGLLRAAGIPALASTGFLAHGKEVSTKNLHATAYAIFPNPEGGNMLVRVEGTPHGIDAEQEKEMAMLGLVNQSITEKEKLAEEEIKKITSEAEKKLEKILDDLQSGDVEKIRALTNGKLESALNAILKYEVKNSHVSVFTRVLDAYWYSPAKDFDIASAKDKVQFLKFLEAEIKNARALSEKEDTTLGKPAGTYLFDMIRAFAKKIEKEGKAKNTEEAYILIDQVTMSLKDNLNTVEQRAILAIVTYLKAKKVLE